VSEIDDRQPGEATDAILRIWAWPDNHRCQLSKHEDEQGCIRGLSAELQEAARCALLARERLEKLREAIYAILHGEGRLENGEYAQYEWMCQELNRLIGGIGT